MNTQCIAVYPGSNTPVVITILYFNWQIKQLVPINDPWITTGLHTWTQNVLQFPRIQRTSSYSHSLLRLTNRTAYTPESYRLHGRNHSGSCLSAVQQRAISRMPGSMVRRNRQAMSLPACSQMYHSPGSPWWFMSVSRPEELKMESEWGTRLLTRIGCASLDAH